MEAPRKPVRDAAGGLPAFGWKGIFHSMKQKLFERRNVGTVPKFIGAQDVSDLTAL